MAVVAATAWSLLLGALAPGFSAAATLAPAASPVATPNARAFHQVDAATFSFANKAAGLTGAVDGHGLSVRTSPAAPAVSLRSASLGRGSSLSTLTSGTPVATDETASLQHGQVVEWFQNRANAVEQGWTIPQRPAGSGDLTVALDITGGRLALAGDRALTIVPSSGPSYVYDGLVARDARGASLPARFSLRAGGAGIVVDDTGATYPVVVDPDLAAVNVLATPPSTAGNQLGADVAVNGRWMAVKEPTARLNPTAPTRLGRIDLYHDSTGNGSWQPAGTLDGSSDSSTMGLFGVALLVEPAGVTVFGVLSSGGTRIWTLAGDPDTVAPNATPVLRQTVSQVSPSGTFVSAPTTIAADGALLATGSPSTTDNGVRSYDASGNVIAPNEQIGAVEVFRRSGGFGGSYAFEARLDPPGGITLPPAQRDVGQLFGTGLAIDATAGLVVVGAPGDDGVQTHTGGDAANPAPLGTSTKEGAVDVFSNGGGTTWSQISRFTAATTVAGAQFGSSVGLAASGTVVVGAPTENNGSAAAVGAGYVFDRQRDPNPPFAPTNTWAQVLRALPDDPNTTTNEAVANSQMGTKVAVATDPVDPTKTRLYFSAPNQSISTGLSGAVYAWTRAGSSAPAFATRLIAGTASDQHGGRTSGYGGALSASGTAVGVGASAWGDAAETFAGQVVTFADNGTSFVRTSELTSASQVLPDSFGTAVAQDGDVLAVSLPSSARGSGFGTGGVAVYDRNPDPNQPNTWVFEQMLFPYSSIQTSDAGTWGSALAIHVNRNAQGQDVGLVVAVGDPTDSRFDPDGNGPTAATTRSNGGSVALFGRDGAPGTTWGFGYKLWAGGRAGSNPLSDLSSVTVGGHFGQSLAFTADGTLVVGEPGSSAGHGTLHRFDTGSTSFLNYLFKEAISPAGATDFAHTVAADGTTVLAVSGSGSGIYRYTDGGVTSNLAPNGAFPLSLTVSTTEPMALSASGSRFAVSGGDPALDGARRVRVYRFVAGTVVREGDLHENASALDLSHGGSVPTLVVGKPGAPEADLYVDKVKSDGSGQWSLSGGLTVPGTFPVPNSQFGTSVTNWPLNGGASIGAPGAALPTAGAGAVVTYDDSGVTPPAGPQAFVDVSLPASVPVGASELGTAGLKPTLLTQSTSGVGSVAAAPLGSIDLGQAPVGTGVSASPLGSIPLGSIPLGSIPLGSIPLGSIPLGSIAGGWDAVLAGTQYAGVPLQSVMLSDVYSLPSVQALPLSALSVAGSPLGSIPLGSIALGTLPLGSIPLNASGTDPIVQWCTALASAGADTTALGLDCSHPAAASNHGVTLLSIGVKGAPLGSIPLGSIPLGSIDMTGTPLGSIPLGSIGLKGSPLGSIPLGSIPLGSIPLGSIPLGSIPLGSIPLGSIPLGSIPLGSIPLGSIPLGSIDLAQSPLGSIPLGSIPLGSIPLGSIPLGSIPLGSIPLGSIPLGSIPLGSIPLGSIPLGSIDIAGSPLGSIPLGSIPLGSIPLGSIPLGSIPLGSIPLGSIPLGSIAVNGSPLGSIPLGSIPLGSIPLGSIPLGSIGSTVRDAVVDCSKVDCATATLAGAAAAGALRSGATLSDVSSLLHRSRLSDLIGSGSGITADQLRAALGSRSLADLSGFDDVSLAELPQVYPYLVLSQVAGLKSGLRLSDVADHLLEYSEHQVQQALANTTLSLADLTGWDDVTLAQVSAVSGQLHLSDLTPALRGIRLADLAGVIQKPGGGSYSSADLRAALQAGMPNAVLTDLSGVDNLTLGDLAAYGDTTVGQLLGALTGNAKQGLTLSDLLLALLNPRQYPWQALDVSSAESQALAAATSGSAVHVAFRADAPDGLPRTVEVTVQLPAGSRYVPGSAGTTLDGSTPAPTVSGNVLTWSFDDVPANAVQDLTFQLEAPFALGATQVTASAFLPADDSLATDTATSSVVERLEPNDTIAQATPLSDDTIVLSHVSTTGDVDVYSFDVSTPGTRVSLSLSNLDSDLDLTLYAPRAGTIVATGPRTLQPVPDDGGSGLPGASQSGATTQSAETGNDITAPTDLGSLAVVQGSYGRGDATEQIDTGVLTQTGTYYVAVTGYNGATSTQPYALRLKRFTSSTEPACPVRTVAPGTVGDALPAQLPTGTTTAILVNRSRMEGLYGADATNDLMSKLTGFVTWLNGNATLGRKAVVLSVDADSAVRAAYQRWDASPCLPSGANGVVSEIARVLNGYRNGGATIKDVVLVGGDDAIPFARVPDATKVANESGYASTVSDLGANALYATFATSSVQTDNAYVDLKPYAFGDRTLSVPDTSIGRLVESPAQIGDQLTDFENANGKLAVGTGLVTGYDFLTDGANAVADQVQHTYGTVDRHLVSDTWTRQQLEDAISTEHPNLLSLNAHFDHYRALPGAGNTTHDETDLFTAAAVRGALNGDLAGSIVFSMGCHGGLSASDLLLSGPRALDFAQAVSSQGGVFVGNTGFGYGDTDTVALSEQLMTDFAQRLNGSMTVGEALLYAKNAYFSRLAEFTPYDEKVLNETTFYGLPFYRLDVANPPSIPAPVSPVISNDSLTGIDAASTHLAPTYATRTADDGTTYVAAVDPATGKDSLTTVQGRPVEPKSDTEYALPAGRSAHDSLVLGLTSTDTPGTDPYVFQPVVDNAGERVDVGTDTAFPTRPVRVNDGLSPNGETFHVAATDGYFRTTAADGTGLQRTYSSMDLVTYLPSSASTDYTAPTFSLVSAQVHDGVATFTAHVSDDQGAANGVRRVRVLLLEDPRAGVKQTWRGLDLTRTGTTDLWSGSLPTNGRNLELILQAVDASGNVGVTTDKASNFTDADVPGQTPGTDPISPVVLSLSGPQGGGGWYLGPVTVTATGGTQLVQELVGESDPVGYQGPFTVSGTGVHHVRVTSGDGTSQSADVRIDTVGPVAHLISPANGSNVPASGFPVSFECTDAGSGASSCGATFDGTSVANGAVLHPTAGLHTIVVTAGPDVAGNQPSVRTVTQTVQVVGAPVVGAITVTKAKDGTPTTLSTPFVGLPGVSYSGTITWGDGTQTNCDMAGAGCTVTRSSNGNGVLTVAHTYATSAPQTTATVTVRDQFAQAGSGSVLVNRTTALAVTPALLKIGGNGIVTLTSGSVSATLTSAGAALPGQTVTFSLPSGAVICTATTDANGRAACPTGTVWTVAMVLAGRYVATFSGRDVYRGTTGTASLIG